MEWISIGLSIRDRLLKVKVKVKVKVVQTDSPYKGLPLLTQSVPQYADYTRMDVSLHSFLPSALELLGHIQAAPSLTPG